jgi:hypothetical protein
MPYRDTQMEGWLAPVHHLRVISAVDGQCRVAQKSRFAATRNAFKEVQTSGATLVGIVNTLSVPIK